MQTALCAVVRNEQDILPKCLDSVQSFVDERIVVDTGSTDSSREIARSRGARVVDFSWTDDFSAARNESLRHATSDWVLVLDADEYLDAENARRLRALLDSQPHAQAAFLLKQLCRSATPGDPGTVYDQVRLFPNHPSIRWEGRVHEQILPSILRAGFEVRQTDIVIEHTGYQDPEVLRQKLQRNLRLMELARADGPLGADMLYHLGSTYFELGRVSESVATLQQAWQNVASDQTFYPLIGALLAKVLRNQRAHAQALEICRTARSHYPDDPHMLIEEAVTRHETRDLAGAETCLVRLMQAPPPQYPTVTDLDLKGTKAKHNLAVVYREQGRLAEADHLWRSLTEASPHFAPAWRALGELCYLQGRLPEALQLAATLESLTDGRTDALVLRSRILIAQGQSAQATELLRAAVRQLPQDPIPLLLLAEVALQERDLTTAEHLLHQVLALDPQNPTAQEGFRVVEQLGSRNHA